MSDTENRERFGRYLILDHLVDGGMAKICRARFLGEQADKVVAIKMVQPQFSRDEGFKTMFMDEIRLTFGLIHPNIIQTYDYGIHKGQLFVAMEYCDGRNLKQYLDKLRERKFVFPVEISTFIISQACQGLHYAHTLRDKLTGQEANIIHRDISPHNIMLSYDGSVKIIDFGIAKSQTNTEATQAGTIKGKLSYLAPEYLDGLELDTRYDQFALGITLWEMLCSRKLFKENNDLAVLKKIQECKIPAPSSINPNVPKELDEIVLKALSKDRTNRYDNLDQMNRALMKFLYSKYIDFNSTDLSYFAQELFKEEIKADRLKMFEYGKIDIKPYLNELRNEAVGLPGSAVADENKDSVQLKKETVLDFGFEDKNNPSKNITMSRKTVLPKKKDPRKQKESSYTKDFDRNLRSKDQTSKISLKKTTQQTTMSRKEDLSKLEKFDRTKVTQSNFTTSSKKKNSSFIKVASVLIILGAIGFYAHDFMYNNSKYTGAVTKLVVEEKDKSRVPAQNEVGGNEAPQGVAKVTLARFNKQKMKVFVDGVSKSVDLLNGFDAPVGKPFTLRVEIVGRKHFIQEINLMNNTEIEVEIPNMPLVSYAYLTSSKSCASRGEIRYQIFDEERQSMVPIEHSYGIAFPLNVDKNDAVVETDYEVLFKSAAEKIERKIKITFKREDQSVDICEFL